MSPIYSTDDAESVIESVNILKSTIHTMDICEFTHKGHFVLESMKTDVFPELLSILTGV